MSRTTIDFGIDLGTTNSSLAVLKGNDTEIIKNNEGNECTPSAIWIDNKGRLQVGRIAKERCESDYDNTAKEFKLQMGSSIIYKFKASGREMKPEELSAEILKSLRSDLQQRKGEDLNAVVITTPAAFLLPNCEATKKAAKLAGLDYTPLLQEPVAAALAYGFQSQSDHVFWLVYDFGGGTFDAAIVNIQDGVIQVVNHIGDNSLGGKLIDWEIVDQLFIPSLKKTYELPDFDRSNPKWLSTFAKLKQHAEEAKIQLSNNTTFQVNINPLCQDAKGNWVDFEYEVSRKDIEPLIEPFVEQTVNICKKVMSEKHLGKSDFEKIILVGGPTLTPLLREILSNRLSIDLEYGVDPLTVVARGAAIFAGTQQLSKIIPQTISKTKYSLLYECKSIDTDPEPLIGGRVVAPEGAKTSGFCIEFIEIKSQWRSGKITLMANGAFTTNLYAEKDRLHEYLIELTDSTGRILEIIPDKITYTIGISISNPPLTHSIGVSLANNEMQVLLKKGASLPARARVFHRTTIYIKKGQSKTILRIPFVEGEDTRRADRNNLIGYLEVPGDKIKRDVPVGSEVEITIIIDEDRQTKTKAFIPILDEEFEGIHSLSSNTPGLEELAREVGQENARFKRITVQANQIQDIKALEIIQNIGKENILHDIESALAAAKGGEQNAADRCYNRLLDLKKAIDKIEDILEWPLLVEEGNQKLKNARSTLEKYGKNEDLLSLNVLEKEIEIAIEKRDPDLLHHKIEEVSNLEITVQAKHPEFWVGFFYYLTEQKSLMNDQPVAGQLLDQGNRAIKNNDIDGLQSAVRQLIKLLPAALQQEARGYGGNTMPF